MSVFYSKKGDVLAEAKAIRNIPSYQLLDDWILCTIDQAEMFYFGITMPAGMQRKANTLELEDIPYMAEGKLHSLLVERDKLLKGTDWYVIRKMERGLDIPQSVSVFRKALVGIDSLENYPDVELPEIPSDVKFVY